MGEWDDTTMRLSTKPDDAVDPESDLSSLGNLLTVLHGLTQHDIAQALQYQEQHPGVKIGEALISLGFVDEAAVHQACQDQKLLRSDQPSEQRAQMILREAERAKQRVETLDQAIERYNEMVGKIAKKVTK